MASDDATVGDAGSLTALPALLLAADRLDALAEAADLMDDPDGMVRFRCAAEELREQAMGLLDD